MNCAGARVAIALTVLVLAGCKVQPAASLRVIEAAPSEAATGASLRLDLGGAPAVRKLLSVDQTPKVRLTIESPALQTPYTKDVDVKNQTGMPNVAVTDAPPLDERTVLTVQFLTGAGQVVDGLYYRTVVEKLTNGENVLTVSDLSTLYGDVYKDVMVRFADKATNTSLDVLRDVVDNTIANHHAASPRLVNAQAIATVVAGADGKQAIPTDAAWVGKPGYVSVGFLDAVPGVPVKVSVDDVTSAAVISAHGEPVQIGPVTPRDAAYKLRVEPLVDDPALSPDLAPQEFQIAVSQANPVAKLPSVFFSKSLPGDALPGRLGGAPGVVIGDALWMLGGLEQPAGDPAGIIDAPRVRVPATLYKYTRAAKWTAANPIPPDNDTDPELRYPRFGSAVAVDGTKVYVFGGQRGDNIGSNRAWVYDTAAGGAGALIPAKMGLSPARLQFSDTTHLAEASAAKLGSKIYVAGGTLTYPGNNPPVDPRGFTDMLEFDPATGTFNQNPPPGLDEEQVCAGMAGAVVDDAWYLWGGYRGGDPSAAGYVFRPGGGWSSLASEMPTPRSNAATVVVNGKIWFIGGEERLQKPSRAVEVYDPVADAWARRAPLKAPRSMATAGLVKTADGKDRIVVAGGVSIAHPTELGLPLPADKVEELVP